MPIQNYFKTHMKSDGKIHTNFCATQLSERLVHAAQCC